MLVEKAMYENSETRFNLCDLEDKFGSNVTAKAKIESIKETAKSVGCLVRHGHFESREESSAWTVNPKFFDSKTPERTLKEKVKIKYTHNGAVTINFADEPCLGVGTAFLCGIDLILTAAHCFFQRKRPTELVPQYPTVLIFDYEHKREQTDKPYAKLCFEHKNVYKIKHVVAHELIKGTKDQEKNDWALLKLDRPVEGRCPLKINFSAKIEMSKSLWMLGHPWGTPIKFAGDGTVMQVNSILGKNFFGSTLAAFIANSGSPIFFEGDESGGVIGMLCVGRADYSIHQNGVLKENKPSISTLETIGYENCLKMTAMRFVRAALDSIDRQFPNRDAVYKDGLSLEGECTSCNKLVVHHYAGLPENDQDKIKVDVAKACCKTFCPKCEQKLDYDKVNTMVLSNCTYEIDARNTDGNSVVGTFHLVPLSGAPAAFTLELQSWFHIHLKISQLFRTSLIK